MYMDSPSGWLCQACVDGFAYCNALAKRADEPNEFSIAQSVAEYSATTAAVLQISSGTSNPTSALDQTTHRIEDIVDEELKTRSIRTLMENHIQSLMAIFELANDNFGEPQAISEAIFRRRRALETLAADLQLSEVTYSP